MASTTAIVSDGNCVIGPFSGSSTDTPEAQPGEHLEDMLLDSLPNLKRWARRKLPQAARGHMDTGDLVQEVALLTVARLAQFSPRHANSMSAYLRQVARNRVCDEFRRLSRRPQSVPLDETFASEQSSPLASAILAEEQQRYRAALQTLRTKDRHLLLARYEHECNFAAIAEQFAFPSVAAARMAVGRAERRLMHRLDAAARSIES